MVLVDEKTIFGFDPKYSIDHEDTSFGESKEVNQPVEEGMEEADWFDQVADFDIS